VSERSRSRAAVAVAVGVVVFALDLTSKILVVANLTNHPVVVLLGGLLRLSLVRNPGAAFSIGTSYTAVFAIIEVVVIFAILRLSGRLRSWLWTVALGLVLGGATGNLTERLLRAPGPLRGYVIDWIKLPYFPPWFNLADSSIVLGAALVILANVIGVGIDGQRARHGADAGKPGPDPEQHAGGPEVRAQPGG
jgi:signal peptidase II